MIISRLRLKNWRNFRDVDVELGSRVFLVGANASGKSNFLDVFRFLRDIAKSKGGGLQQAVEERKGVSRIRCLAARKESQIEIEIELAEEEGQKPKWKYEIGIKQESRGLRRPYLDQEKVWDSHGNQILARPDDDDKQDKARLWQTHLEQISANKGFREIADVVASVSYLHLIPQLLRHPEIVISNLAEEDPYGRNFLEQVAQTPIKTRNSRLRKIEEALRIAVPQLTQLRDYRDSNGTPHLEATYAHWRPMAGRQSEEEFSDGTLRLIGFLWMILSGDSPLLLEEPELYLHSGIVKRLPGLIWRIQSKRKRQIFISTHSAEMLENTGIDSKDVLLLIPDKNGTNIERASSNKEIKDLLKSGFSIAEAVLPMTEPKDIRQLELFRE